MNSIWIRHNAMAALFVRREDDEFVEFSTPAFQRLKLDDKEAAS